jgi:hypothetical protein
LSISLIQWFKEPIQQLEVVSKPQIRSKGKAQADPPSPSDERRAMAGQVEKAQSA